MIYGLDADSRINPPDPPSHAICRGNGRGVVLHGKPVTLSYDDIMALVVAVNDDDGVADKLVTILEARGVLDPKAVCRQTWVDLGDTYDANGEPRCPDCGSEMEF